MFEVVLTYRDFTEKTVETVGTADEAREAVVRRRKDENCLRARWRAVQNVLERCFYEPERCLIQEALKLIPQAELTADNMAERVESVIVERIESGVFGWADSDMAATAIAKLQQLPGEHKRKVLNEFYGDKH